MAFWNKWEPVSTRVAGVMSGPEAATRQLALSLIKEEMRKEAHLPTRERRRFFIDLVPEPENVHDPDAVQCMADVPGLGRTQLGYVRNSDTTCGFCEHLMEKRPKNNCCLRCGRNELSPGLASKLSQAMRENPEARFYGEVQQISGGEDGKSFGCAYQIKQVFERKKRG